MSQCFNTNASFLIKKRILGGNEVTQSLHNHSLPFWFFKHFWPFKELALTGQSPLIYLDNQQYKKVKRIFLACALHSDKESDKEEFFIQRGAVVKTEEGYSADIYPWRYMSAQCLHYVRTISAQCPHNVRTLSAQHLTMSLQYRHNVCTISVQCGHYIGTMSAKCPHYILLWFFLL